MDTYSGDRYIANPFFNITIFLLIIFAVSIGGCNKPPKEMAFVPAGEFLMGTDEVDQENLGIEIGLPVPFYEDEHPLHRVRIPSFFIDHYEVTNKQYKDFVDVVNRHVPNDWVSGTFPAGKDQFPVIYVNWYDANDYCRWKGKRLPTEEEWEKAARGPDGLKYPWGNIFSTDKAFIAGGAVMFGSSRAVGDFEAGKSPYGVYDMIGNVWEWTHSWYLPYEGNRLRKKSFGQLFRVTKGLSFMSVGHYDKKTYRKAVEVIARTSFRSYDNPSSKLADLGFRCAKPAR